MLSNIAGTVQDTVDYRKKMFKQLYHDIYEQGRQDRLLQELEKSDELNDGKVTPKELLRILQQVTN